MKKILLSSFVIAMTLYVCGQTMVLNDPVSARVFSSEKYSGYNGSPFLFNDKWTPGNVTVPKGIYKNLELKLDVYSNVLFFKRNEEPFEFQDQIVDFVLTPNIADSNSYMYFKRGLSGENLKPQQYVQVLAEGKTGLYKSDIKLLSDVNQINQGVVKTFTTASRYFILKDNQLQLIRPGKKEVLQVLNDKAEQVQTFINGHKTSFKNDADLAALFKYYNSL